MSLALRILVAASLIAAGCGGAPDPMPPSLIGVWTTSNTKYAGRALKFDPHGVVRFVQGRQGEHRGWITSVDSESLAPNRQRFELEYRTMQGTAFDLELELDTESGVLLMNNRRDVPWKRESRP